MTKDTSLDLDRRRLLRAVSVGAGALALSESAPSASAAPIDVATETDRKVKVRTITAFITISSGGYEAEIRTAVAFLSKVRSSAASLGYEVMTLRVVTQPVEHYTRGLSRNEAALMFRRINSLAKELAFTPNLGPVMPRTGETAATADLLVEVLSSSDNVSNASIIVADDAGISWEAVRQAGDIVKRLSVQSDRGLGNFNFAAVAMMRPYGPFYPAAWHPGGSKKAFAIGLQGAGLVIDAFAKEQQPDAAGALLAELLTTHAQKIEQAAMTHDGQDGWSYAGLDPTPAPLGKVSIGAAVEVFLGVPFGSPGTETACGVITRAVQSVAVRRTGYSGLMLPVLEDEGLSRRWSEGTFGLDSILAYSAVCAGGLDTIPLPGSISAEVISRLIGDVATLAFRWNKPLAARLLPAPGKQVGERTAFSGGALGDATIQPLSGSPRAL